MRQQPFLEAREKYGVEFEALRAMQRHQRNGDGLVVFVGIARERGVIEQILERLALLGGFGHGVREFAQIFRARRVLEIVLLLDPIEITGAVEDALDQLRGRQILALCPAGLRSIRGRNAARR